MTVRGTKVFRTVLILAGCIDCPQSSFSSNARLAMKARVVPICAERGQTEKA